MTHSSVGDALFTKTQQQVLGVLYGNPVKSFYLNEIVRLTSVGKGAVARELKKLVAVGLLSRVEQGNQSHYQANRQHPIFEELRGIVRKTFGVVGEIATALEMILPSVSQAFIYGSVAKGSEHASSDIDVLLVGDDLSYADVMTALTEAEHSLARTINPTLLTCKEFDERLAANQSFLTRVMEQPKLWIKHAAH